MIKNVRGVGSLVAFDGFDPSVRDSIIKGMANKGKSNTCHADCAGAVTKKFHSVL